MPAKNNYRTIVVFALLLVLMAAAFSVNICVGNVRIDFNTALDHKTANIILNIRLPRTIMALVLGGALAVSGFLLQTYFLNPIAGPYILGISSGAKMTVALFLIYAAGRKGYTNNFIMVLAAFAGALMSTGFIILISKRVRNMAALLAAGIMIGYICNAITDFLIAFADDSELVNLHGWSQGSFSGADMAGAVCSIIIVTGAMLLCFFLVKSLDALRLGEAYARSVGVNIRSCRILIILLSSILSACVTAFAGPVSFVGIAVPFLMREALQSSKPVILIPASFMAGAVFCLISDLMARMLFAPVELNISAVTSLFGAPIVIFMLIRRHKSSEN